MAKKKKDISPRERAVKEIEKTLEELGTLADDFRAILTGGIGPTERAYIEKINSAWEKYNFIVVFGHVYQLTNEKHKRDNGTLRTPCENCELSEYCVGSDNTCEDAGKLTLCNMMDADTDEWFKDVGELSYRPSKDTFKIKPWFKR